MRKKAYQFLRGTSSSDFSCHLLLVRLYTFLARNQLVITS